MISEETQLPLQIPDGFDALSSAQKLKFLAALWDRTEPGVDVSELHEAVVAKVVNARLEELKARPEIGLSAAEVVGNVRSRMRR